MTAHRLLRTAAAMIMLASGPAVAQKPAATVSAPLANIRYDVTFDSITAQAKTLQVAMSFDVTGPGPVLLSFPAWTPGAYELSFFARWVSNFVPVAGDKQL